MVYLNFMKDFMRLDSLSTVDHENKRNAKLRDLDLVQKPLYKLSLAEAIDIYWRCYKYFNSLEAPILDKESIEKLLTVAACYKPPEAVYELQKVVAKIPKTSYLILKSICLHFYRLSMFSDASALFSIGTVFGPCLFRTTNVYSD